MEFSYSQTENFEMEKLSSDTGYFKKPVEINRGLGSFPIMPFSSKSWLEILADNTIVQRNTIWYKSTWNSEIFNISHEPGEMDPPHMLRKQSKSLRSRLRTFLL